MDYKNLDLYTLARLANEKREALHGNKTFYVNNLHIDYSNICSLNCDFCAFSRHRGDEQSFELSIDTVLHQIRENRCHGITEVHIVGGIHPTLPYEFYTDLLREIRAEFPTIHIKALGAIEVDFLARRFGKTVRDVLADFIDCGLNMLPGGGAEILVDSVREKLCPEKGPSEIWLNVHRTAHQLGIKTNATMLYGHIESLDDRLEHMHRIRKLQEETGGFHAFIPLKFHPHGKYASLQPTTAYEDLKTIALSRVVVDNVPHIKAYWVMLGLNVAQIAQHFGADDLHGTVIQENITRMAGGRAPQGVTEEELCRLITEAGREPVPFQSQKWD